MQIRPRTQNKNKDGQLHHSLWCGSNQADRTAHVHQPPLRAPASNGEVISCVSTTCFLPFCGKENTVRELIHERHIFGRAERKPCYVTNKGGEVDKVLIVQYNILLLWSNGDICLDSSNVIYPYGFIKTGSIGCVGEGAHIYFWVCSWGMNTQKHRATSIKQHRTIKDGEFICNWLLKSTAIRWLCF